MEPTFRAAHVRQSAHDALDGYPFRMTKEQLLALASAQEDAFVERKAEGVSRRDIRKAACAFANTVDGRDGVLFIGVDDRTGAVLGVRDTDTLQKPFVRRVPRTVTRRSNTPRKCWRSRVSRWWLSSFLPAIKSRTSPGRRTCVLVLQA